MKSIKKEENKEIFNYGDNAKDLVNALNNPELMKCSSDKLREVFNGKKVNQNPLIEIPEPEMRLYQLDNHYFLSIHELISHSIYNRLPLSDMIILDYHKTLAGNDDVIIVHKNKQSIFYSACEKDGYGVYNYERSIYCGKFIWEWHGGNIRKLYKPFKDRGIIFQHDIYAEADEEEQQLLQLCKKRNWKVGIS